MTQLTELQETYHFLFVGLGLRAFADVITLKLRNRLQIEGHVQETFVIGQNGGGNASGLYMTFKYRIRKFKLHVITNAFANCEGVFNTITQLRLLSNVFLELHYWANRVKYVLPNISKLYLGFSLKLFVRTGWTSDCVLK